MTLQEEWSYEFKAWIVRLGSMPVELIISEDQSESYEMDRRHVFKLENGQYALISEVGCSCYMSEEADIELYPNKAAALKAFKKPRYEGGKSWGAGKL